MRPVEDTLKEALEYRDGKLFWRDTWPCETQGREAGGVNISKRDNTSYRRIAHRDSQYMTHRVIWLLHYGEWPKGQIDHINGDSLDNRIENLRDVTARENMFNRPMYKNNRVGLKGVTRLHYQHKDGEFLARISKDSKLFRIGVFRCPTRAALAYDRKARELHGEHARVNFPALLD